MSIVRVVGSRRDAVILVLAWGGCLSEPFCGVGIHADVVTINCKNKQASDGDNIDWPWHVQ